MKAHWVLVNMNIFSDEWLRISVIVTSSMFWVNPILINWATGQLLQHYIADLSVAFHVMVACCDVGIFAYSVAMVVCITTFYNNNTVMKSNTNICTLHSVTESYFALMTMLDPESHEWPYISVNFVVNDVTQVWMLTVDISLFLQSM